MEAKSAEFIWGSRRYLVTLNRAGHADVSLLSEEGPTDLLHGRWDPNVGALVSWQADLLAPASYANDSLATAAGGTLRVLLDWQPPNARQAPGH